ncbi:hypothetical protein H072_4129 [Dactylellina haptotyla CBS 200.50]|uniref:Major facilitator superfamily (MFS) profile domain-containing protein n=1 Tax=Dactylellina haptotyla (strain CBS 200.50) TaxID=1284197 RepID=S8AGC8_DACHA|nr:hypothetical protein H072_4129 [Dactylellina haptotyla CBS 200.50]
MPVSTLAAEPLGDIDKEARPQAELSKLTESEKTSSADELDAPVPPDGGLQAWSQVFGAFFLFFASWGFVNAFGVYQNYYYTEHLKGTPATNISWIGSIQGFLLMFIGVLTGPLYDKGHFRPLLYVGAFLVVLGIMMTSLSTKYYQVLLAQGICIGLGTGCLFVPSVAVIAGYFTMKRSFATGLASTGGSIGGIVYSVAFRTLVDKIGFGWSTRFLGFLTMVLLAISLTMMKPLQFPAGPRSLLLPSAFKEPSYTLASVGLMVTFMGLYVPYFHIQGYAGEYVGLNKDFSYQLLTIMNVASIFGRTIPTLVADRIGPINAMIPAAVGTAVMGFAWIGIRTVPSTVVFAVFYGFLSGTVVSLPPTTITSMGGKPSEVGTRLGMSFTFAATGLLTGNPMAGSLIDIPNGKFRGAQILCGSLVTAGTLLFVAARVLMPKPKEASNETPVETAEADSGGLRTTD